MNNERNMLDQLRCTIDLMNETAGRISFQSFSDCIPDSVIKNIMFVTLTGNGSGFQAAQAARALFEDTNSGNLCGSVAETQLALYFNRFSENQKGWRSPLMRRTLLVAIDYDGVAGETAGAVKRMNQRGGNTVAVTSDVMGELAREAQYVVPLAKPEYTYGTTDKYNVQTLTAMMLGLYFSMVKGRLSAANADTHRRSIMHYINSFSGEAMHAMEEKTQKIAEDWKNTGVEYADIVADGYEFTPAQFGADRLVDQGGIIAMLDDTEDWNHIPFWTQDPEKVGTVLFANTSSPSFGRSIENACVYTAFERKLVIITDSEEKGLFPESAEVISLPKPSFRWALPVMQHLPLAYIAAFLSKA